MAQQNWKKDWETAKKEFKEITGKKKPNAHVEKTFFNHASGIEKLLEKAEAVYRKIQDKKGLTQQDIDLFKEAIAAFQKAKDEYIKVLESAIEKEVKDKGEKTVYAKACKFLEKKLEAIQGGMENQVGWLDSKLKGLKTVEAMAATLIKSIKNSAQKCVAAAAKVKASPTKETFDSNIYDPARDLSQYIGNIAVLRKKGQTIPDKYSDTEAQALYDVIRPYGTEQLKTKLPANADTEVVLTELKKFIMAVKSAMDFANK